MLGVVGGDQHHLSPGQWWHQGCQAARTGWPSDPQLRCPLCWCSGASASGNLREQEGGEGDSNPAPQGAQQWGALGCTRCKSLCESAHVHGGCERAVLCVPCGCSSKICVHLPYHVLACVPTLVCSSMHRYVHVHTWLAGTAHVHLVVHVHARACSAVLHVLNTAYVGVCVCICVCLSASLSLHRCARMSVCMHYSVCASAEHICL